MILLRCNKKLANKWTWVSTKSDFLNAKSATPGPTVLALVTTAESTLQDLQLQIMDARIHLRIHTLTVHIHIQH